MYLYNFVHTLYLHDFVHIIRTLFVQICVQKGIKIVQIKCKKKSCKRSVGLTLYKLSAQNCTNTFSVYLPPGGMRKRAGRSVDVIRRVDEEVTYLWPRAWYEC